jgi:hypothetical protein
MSEELKEIAAVIAVVVTIASAFGIAIMLITW